MCVPTARPIGTVLLGEIRERVYGVRQDVPDHHVVATEVIRELYKFERLKPIFLLAGGKMRRDHPFEGGQAWSEEGLFEHTRDACIKLRDLGYFEPGRELAIEFGNEPDIAAREWQGRDNARRLGRLFVRAYHLIREFSEAVTVLTPSISNLDKDSIAYFQEMADAADGFPDGSTVAIHRYPPEFDPMEPHRGFERRRDELACIRGFVPDRPIWVTEFGVTEVRDDGDERITPEQAAEYIERDIHYWKSEGIERADLYQINDGPDENNWLHHFGVRFVNGKWKPIAEKLTKLRDEVAA